MSEFDGFEKIVRFRPAFDKRHADPAKNYGIHGVELLMLLKGSAGAVQFVVYTNWHLPHVQADLDAQPLNEFPYMFHSPQPADLGYHSPRPRYEGQQPIESDCEWTGGECYYNGSTLNAGRAFEVLLREGDEGVWRELRETYERIFQSKEMTT